MLQFARYGFRYASELICNARCLADSLGTISPNQQVSEYLANNRIYPSSAMGLLGSMFYDMAVGNDGVSHERELVRMTSSRITLLTDIVDDIIDKRPTTPEEKFNFLDKGRLDLFGYSANTSEDLHEEACYILARAIYSDFLSKDKERKVERIFDELFRVIKQQFTETDYNELLAIAKTIGSCRTDTTAVLTDIVTGREYPAIRESARKIGEYSELLDNLYELDKDLAEGVNTYPTVKVRQEGDSPALRREIKKELLMLADESIAEGFSCLSTQEQKTIYKVLKTMIDFKYRFVERLC